MLNYTNQLKELLEITAKEQASDLHISVNHQPILRLGGALLPLKKLKILSPEDTAGLSAELMSNEQRERFLKSGFGRDQLRQAIKRTLKKFSF